VFIEVNDVRVKRMTTNRVLTNPLLFLSFPFFNTQGKPFDQCRSEGVRHL
jgi:hypothetical protein